MSVEFRLYGVEKEDLYDNQSNEDKERIRVEMVLMARERGIKPTARYFNTYPATVRRWMKKYSDLSSEVLINVNNGK